MNRCAHRSLLKPKKHLKISSLKMPAVACYNHLIARQAEGQLIANGKFLTMVDFIVRFFELMPRPQDAPRLLTNRLPVSVVYRHEDDSFHDRYDFILNVYRNDNRGFFASLVRQNTDTLEVVNTLALVNPRYVPSLMPDTHDSDVSAIMVATGILIAHFNQICQIPNEIKTPVHLVFEEEEVELGDENADAQEHVDEDAAAPGGPVQ